MTTNRHNAIIHLSHAGLASMLIFLLTQYGTIREDIGALKVACGVTGRHMGNVVQTQTNQIARLERE